jgi:hypothetical protein
MLLERSFPEDAAFLQFPDRIFDHAGVDPGDFNRRGDALRDSRNPLTA